MTINQGIMTRNQARVLFQLDKEKNMTVKELLTQLQAALMRNEDWREITTPEDKGRVWFHFVTGEKVKIPWGYFE